ncbi:MAG: MmgE/PrpD family protein [Pseudomonadota bacterium]
MTRTDVTAALAEFSIGEVYLPENVQTAGVRALTNIVGCMFGGVEQQATQIARDLAVELGGTGTTSLIGHAARVDMVTGAYLNCMASAAHAFDDTHLATVIHPSGPVIGPLFALAEREALSGQALIEALVVGIEVQCRVGAALLVPPAKGQLGWYGTGIAGALGAAAASARALGLNHTQTCSAFGVAANMASGFRQTHGTMCTSHTPAHSARCGLYAALLAARGFDGGTAALEGDNGYLQVFSFAPNPAAATTDLGKAWHTLDNTFKPYPCGIVIHPVLDACLEIVRENAPVADRIDRIDVTVNPLCLMLCDRPTPPDAQLAQVSVQHWAAVALLTGRAGLPEVTEARVADPEVAALRSKVRTHPDDTINRDGARVDVHLADGQTFSRAIEHGIGSTELPMTDAQIDAKFMAQAEMVLKPSAAGEILKACRKIQNAGDVAAALIRLCRPDY